MSNRKSNKPSKTRSIPLRGEGQDDRDAVERMIGEGCPNDWEGTWEERWLRRLTIHPHASRSCARNLSRIRSPMTSRSNCANDRRILSVTRAKVTGHK